MPEWAVLKYLNFDPGQCFLSLKLFLKIWSDFIIITNFPLLSGDIPLCVVLILFEHFIDLRLTIKAIKNRLHFPHCSVTLSVALLRALFSNYVTTAPSIYGWAESKRINGWVKNECFQISRLWVGASGAKSATEEMSTPPQLHHHL